MILTDDEPTVTVHLGYDNGMNHIVNSVSRQAEHCSPVVVGPDRSDEWLAQALRPDSEILPGDVVEILEAK